MEIETVTKRKSDREVKRKRESQTDRQIVEEINENSVARTDIYRQTYRVENR